MEKSVNSNDKENRKSIQCYERCIEKHPEKIKEVASMYVSLLERHPFHGHELILPMKYVKEYLLTGDIVQKGASDKMKCIAVDLARNGLEPEEKELIKNSSFEYLQVAFYYLRDKDIIEFTKRSTYKLKKVVGSEFEIKQAEKPVEEKQKVFVDVINSLSSKQEKQVAVDENKEQKPVSIIDSITNNIINPLKEKIKNTEKQLIETTAVNVKQREIIDNYREKVFELEQVIKTKNLAIQTQERTTEIVAREVNRVTADQKKQIDELENKVKELQGFNTLKLNEEITVFKKEFNELSEWVGKMSDKIKEV
jgi:hypothetical protein